MHLKPIFHYTILPFYDHKPIHVLDEIKDFALKIRTSTKEIIIFCDFIQLNQRIIICQIFPLTRSFWHDKREKCNKLPNSTLQKLIKLWLVTRHLVYDVIIACIEICHFSFHLFYHYFKTM